MIAKENTLLKAKASVSWIYSNLLGKKANFELLHPTELKHAEAEYVAWVSYLLPIEQALTELEELKQDVRRYFELEKRLKYISENLNTLHEIEDMKQTHRETLKELNVLETKFMNVGKEE